MPQIPGTVITQQEGVRVWVRESVASTSYMTRKGMGTRQPVFPFFYYRKSQIRTPHIRNRENGNKQTDKVL